MLLLTILNIVFCISFVGFAYVNMNDKDSWLWVPIYMVAAILCGLAAFRLFYPAVYIPVMGFYLLYATYLFFARDGVKDWITKYRMQHIAQTMQATKPYIEKTREFFGLLIITAALLINLLVSYNSQP
jgi:Ca2+/Na+ antiporter